MANGTTSKTYTAAEVDALLTYQPGEPVSINNLPVFGNVTGGQKSLELSVVLPKAVPLGATVTVTQLNISLRVPTGGYIESLGYNAFANSNISVRITGGTSFRFVCERSTNWYGTNNVPICGSVDVTMRID